MSQWVTEGSLGAILYNSRIITETDIRKGLTEQERLGCRFGEALVRLGIVTGEDINWALSHHLDIPYIRLNRETMGPDAATLLPERIARHHGVVPLIRTDDELRVAFRDPLDRVALQEIAALCNCSVTIAIADASDIREMQEYLYGPEPKGGFGLLSCVATADEAAAIIADPAGESFLQWLLSLLVRQGYCSITLAPLAGVGVLTGRQGSAPRELGRLTVDASDRLVALLRQQGELCKNSSGAESGSLEYLHENVLLAIRVDLLRGASGWMVTLKSPELTQGAPFPPELVPLIREMTQRPGLVMVSLPIQEMRSMMELLINSHGSGEEQTLLLGEGNKTLREMVPCIPLNALSPEESEAVVTAAQEHEPELLLLEYAGDIRSLHAAARASLGGVRVVAGTGAGIAETFALLCTAWHRHLIPSSLRGIVVGATVTTLCPSCAETLHFKPQEITRLRLPASASGYRHATGCAACAFTGKDGTRLLVEVIPCDRMLTDLLESCKNGDDVAAGLAQQGDHTVQKQAARLLLGGEISPDTYLKAVTA